MAMLMQGIETRYSHDRNGNGLVRATARKRNEHNPALAVTVQRDHARHYDQDHCAAALKMAERVNWGGLWVGAGSADEKGYNWVNLGESAYRSALNPHIAFGEEGRDWFYLAEAKPSRKAGAK